MVRLSGQGARPLAASLCPGGPDWHPRRASLRTVATGALSDRAVVVWMPGPRSFTGEDVVEITCHGNPVVVAAIVDAAVALGARPARPGEFTRRAVENGRLDLLQAEALAAVIDATTAEGVALAQGGLAGGLSSAVAAIREALLDLAAELEARLDQPEGDLEVLDDAAVVAALRAVVGEASALADTWASARPRLQGARVALVGPVNAGKSSLFNHLVGSHRALVSATPGTTRDAVERRIAVGGLDLTVVDTAGERPDPGEIEAAGLRLGRQLAEEADLQLVVWPRHQPLDATGAALLARTANRARLVVETFGDHPRHPAAPPADLTIDNTDGGGLAELTAALATRLGGGPSRADRAVVVSQRQQARLQAVAERAGAAAEALDGFAGPAIASEEVHLALEVLAELTGESAREAVLDRLFSRFCIGK